MKNYISTIKHKKYEYENDEMPNISNLIDDIKKSSKK